MLKQFQRFAGVGLIATALHYAIFIILLYALDIDVVVATCIGAFFGAIASYLLNRKFTFNSQIDHLNGITRFAIIAAIGFCLNGVIVGTSVSWLHLHPIVAQILATGICLVWNFIGNRLWTFADGISSYE